MLCLVYCRQGNKNIGKYGEQMKNIRIFAIIAAVLYTATIGSAIYVASAINKKALAMTFDESVQSEGAIVAQCIYKLDDELATPALIQGYEETAISITDDAMQEQEIEQDSESENNDVEEFERMNVPSIDTWFKAWEDYRCLTDRTTVQYKLQKEAYTDENGFRRYPCEDGDDYYMVAMGTYYTGYRCGKVFRITLDTGSQFMVMTGDVKADIHTDSLNQHRRGNVIEFIVDTKEISNDCSIMGDMSWADEMFKGNVQNIELSAIDFGENLT